MEFDLSKYTLSETSTLEVLDVDGLSPLLGVDDQPVTIELYGPGSEVYVKAQATLDQGLQQIGMASALAMNKGKTPKDSAAELAKLNVAKLVACTKAINNFPVTADKLYEHIGLIYITRQVERHLGNMANFSKRSTPT